MAFAGYLLKIGNFDTVEKYIEFNTYSTSRKPQDLSPYRNANGNLIRNVLPNVPNVISFGVKPKTDSSFQKDIMEKIRANYIPGKENERKLSITLYVPELGKYATQDMYMVDPEFVINRIDNDDIYYDKITLKFIGY